MDSYSLKQQKKEISKQIERGTNSHGPEFGAKSGCDVHFSCHISTGIVFNYMNFLCMMLMNLRIWFVLF